MVFALLLAAAVTLTAGGTRALTPPVAKLGVHIPGTGDDELDRLGW